MYFLFVLMIIIIFKDFISLKKSYFFFVFIVNFLWLAEAQIPSPKPKLRCCYSSVSLYMNYYESVRTCPLSFPVQLKNVQCFEQQNYLLSKCTHILLLPAFMILFAGIHVDIFLHRCMHIKRGKIGHAFIPGLHSFPPLYSLAPSHHLGTEATFSSHILWLRNKSLSGLIKKLD